MAIEMRRVVFSHEESMDAIKAYGSKNDISFPKGKIIRARFAGNPEYEINSLKTIKSPVQSEYNLKSDPRAVTLSIFCDDNLEQKYFNLTADFISTALIEYCIHNKIMLPKDAEKSLDLTDFNICLDISKDNFTAGDKQESRLTLAD